MICLVFLNWKAYRSSKKTRFRFHLSRVVYLVLKDTFPANTSFFFSNAFLDKKKKNNII